MKYGSTQADFKALCPAYNLFPDTSINKANL